MRRALSFLILSILVGVLPYVSASYDLGDQPPKYDASNVTNLQNSTLNITVQTERELSKTLNYALGQDEGVSEGRTFGLRRLKFILLPLMFKLGVVTTLLVMLVVLSLKTFLIGVLLLAIKVGSFISKFHHYPAPHAEKVHESPWYVAPYPWPQPQLQPQAWPQPQPIHVHMHHDGKHHGDLHEYDHPEPYNYHDRIHRDNRLVDRNPDTSQHNYRDTYHRNPYYDIRERKLDYDIHEGGNYDGDHEVRNHYDRQIVIKGPIYAEWETPPAISSNGPASTM